MSFSFTADDEHCIYVRKIQLKMFVSVHCRLKGFIPILNCYTFVMERQCGLQNPCVVVSLHKVAKIVAK